VDYYSRLADGCQPRTANVTALKGCALEWLGNWFDKVKKDANNAITCWKNTLDLSPSLSVCYVSMGRFNPFYLPCLLLYSNILSCLVLYLLMFIWMLILQDLGTKLADQYVRSGHYEAARHLLKKAAEANETWPLRRLAFLSMKLGVLSVMEGRG
jgi:hypothetical protein